MNGHIHVQAQAEPVSEYNNQMDRTQVIFAFAEFPLQRFISELLIGYSPQFTTYLLAIGDRTGAKTDLSVCVSFYPGSQTARQIQVPPLRASLYGLWAVATYPRPNHHIWLKPA
ncbi:hypothetical protein OE88DRAFT_1659174 [Heliocybe sulcata]|uniref:Uncharacterized protein n=1 Tax=Heliocybe sulcata TaxID=5364 RepID=A0A5C3N203_9AGAM|nr:hypothetical protein OE88DRAFT_1659174 [Heliocybe sulcata]